MGTPSNGERGAATRRAAIPWSHVIFVVALLGVDFGLLGLGVLTGMVATAAVIGLPLAAVVAALRRKPDLARRRLMLLGLYAGALAVVVAGAVVSRGIGGARRGRGDRRMRPLRDEDGRPPLEPGRAGPRLPPRDSGPRLEPHAHTASTTSATKSRPCSSRTTLPPFGRTIHDLRTGERSFSGLTRRFASPSGGIPAAA